MQFFYLILDVGKKSGIVKSYESVMAQTDGVR